MKGPPTPDDLPAIGRLGRYVTVFAVTAHPMLGPMLSPLTEYPITGLMGGEQRTHVGAFDPAAFIDRTRPDCPRILQ